MSSTELAIVPHEPSKNDGWITITVAGATAGMVVASLTYSSTNLATNAMATTSGFTVEMLGEALTMGTNYFMGPAAGFTVKMASKAFAKTTEQTVKQSGFITAGILSAVAGTVTALSITAGTRLLEYSIEYGGKVSKELAVQISEAYIKYKAVHTDFEKSGDPNDLMDEEVENEWLLVKNTQEQEMKDLKDMS